MSILSDRIKEKRKERGWTQQDLAEQTHLSLDTIKSWESGRRNPDYTSMKVLCWKLHTTEEYLLGGKDFMKEWLSKYDSEHQEEILKIIYVFIIVYTFNLYKLKLFIGKYIT